MNAHRESVNIDPTNLGYQAMDDIHEDFIEIIDSLKKNTDEHLLNNFHYLASHLIHHFKQEDEWMIETEFPPQKCHIEEHAAVLKSLHEVNELLEQGNTLIARRFIEELENWFPAHAIHLDSALAHWMCKKRFGGKPVIIAKRINI